MENALALGGVLVAVCVDCSMGGGHPAQNSGVRPFETVSMRKHHVCMQKAASSWHVGVLECVKHTDLIAVQPAAVKPTIISRCFLDAAARLSKWT